MIWDSQNPLLDEDGAAVPVPMVVAVENCLIKVDFAFELKLSRIHSFFALTRKKDRTNLLDPQNIRFLPFNGELARYLQTCGRDIRLSSRLPTHYTREIAEFLQIGNRTRGDGCMAGDVLQRQSVTGYDFSKTPFDYVGYSENDIKIWRIARKKIAVWPTRSVWSQLIALDPDSVKIARNKGHLRFWLRLINLKDFPWLIVGPLVFLVLDGGIVNSILLTLLLTLATMSASIMFDLFHLQADRQDQRRVIRPIASGMLGSKIPAAAAVVSAVFATLVSATINLSLVAPTILLLLGATLLGPFKYKFRETRIKRATFIGALTAYAVLASRLIA